MIQTLLGIELKWLLAPVALLMLGLLPPTRVQSQTPGFGVRLIDVTSQVENTTTAVGVAFGESLHPSLIQADISDVYSTFDLAGDSGTFSVNAPYPGGAKIPGNGNDFVVALDAEVTIPAGRWQVGFGSDDGGILTLSGVNFADELNENPVGTSRGIVTGDDTLRYESARSHAWTSATLQLDAPTTTTLSGVFFERSGLDSFELAVRDASGSTQHTVNTVTGWNLLANGVLGWQVSTNVTPGKRIGGQFLVGREQLSLSGPRPAQGDLSYRVPTSLPLVFDVLGPSLVTDQLGLPSNPNANLYRQVLDLNDAHIVIELNSGTLQLGDRLSLIDVAHVDQIVGTPTFTFPFGRWDTSGFLTSGQIELLDGAPPLPQAAAETTWNRPLGGRWSDPYNWSAGLPDANSDVALFPRGLPAASPTITLDVPAVVNQIRTHNPRSVHILGTDSLSLVSNDESDPAVYSGPTAGALVIAAPLVFENGLLIDVTRPTSEVQIRGSISAESSDLIKRGAGQLMLAGDSATWQGSVTVDAGSVHLLHAKGLGSSNIRTILNDGRLAVDVATEEPFTVRGGVLSLGARSGELTLHGGQVQVNANVPVRFASDVSQNGEVIFSIDHNQAITLPDNSDSADASGIVLVGQASHRNPFLERTVGGTVSLLGTPAPLLLAGRGAVLQLTRPLTASNNVATVDVVEGMIQFAAANNYTGQTIVRDGATLILTGNAKLGTSDGTLDTGTFVFDGGTLDAANVIVPANERIIVDGGRISGRFAGPIELHQASAVLSGEFEGTLTSDSAVLFTNVQHRRGTNLWQANHFAGEAKIVGTPEHEVHLFHPQGLGDSTLPTRLISGQLHLHVTSDKPIVAEGGELHIHQPAWHGDIVLSGGTLVGRNSKLELSSPLRLGGSTSTITGLNVNVPIEGTGDLRVQGPTTFSASPTFTGDLRVSGGETQFNVAPQMTGELILEGGGAEFHVDAAAPLRIRGGHLKTAPHATFTATNPIVEISSGSIDGNLAGVERLVIDGAQNVYLRNIGQSDAEIVLRRGTLEVPMNATLGSTARGIVVDGLRHASLSLRGVGDASVELAEPITVLHARGMHGQGGLRFELGGVLSGDLTVHGENAIVGLGSSLSDVTLTGTLRGDSLNVVGDGTLRIANESQHTGATRIGYGGGGTPTLSVGASGRLASTSRVEVYHHGELHVDKREATSAHDLVDDGLAIQMHGGRLALEGQRVTEERVTERIGTVTAVRGAAELAAFEERTRLVIERVAPQGGATVTFFRQPGARLPGQGAEIDAQIVIEQPPEMVRGMLGAWAVANEGFRYDFATVDATGLGIRPLSSSGRKSQLAGAAETDHVLLRKFGPITPLASDTTVASLAVDGQFGDASLRPVDLGGKQLTIGTGGIMGSYTGLNVMNGKLTAGREADGTLYLHTINESHISASITDGPAGEVSLVKSGEFYLYLRGVNTYTGDTIVNNGILFFDRPEAIPATTDVIITGGEIRPDPVTEPAPPRVASVTVHSGTAFGLNADRYLIESGSLIGVTGNGTVTKTSPNDAHLSFDRFRGDVDIREGLVSAARNVGGTTYNVRTNGILELHSSASTQDRITLDGGELIVHGGRHDSIDPPLQVASSALLTVPEGHRRLSLAQGLDLSDEARLTYDGPATLEVDGTVQLHGGATIEHLGGNIEMKASWAATESVSDPHVTLLGPGDAVLRNQIDFALMGDNRLFGGSVTIRDLDVRVTEPFALGMGPTILAAGSTLSFEAADATGNIVLDGGQLSPTSDFAFTGSVTSRSVLSPGASPGRLRVDGSFYQEAEGHLIMEIASPLLTELYSWQHDVVEVTDRLALDGLLEVRLLHGYQPKIGDRFDLFDFSRLDGTFSRIDLPLLADGLTWDQSELYTSGVLQVALAHLPGDIDGDRAVSFADFLILSASFGQPVASPGCCGDINGDGSVGFPDFLILSENFGRSFNTAAAVPEPAFRGTLLASALICLLRSRCRSNLQFLRNSRICRE